MARAIVLMSGGLDSMLAARILQLQGLDVIGFNFRMPFNGTSKGAMRAAADLGVPLIAHYVGDEYMEVLRNPKHGYGKGANPCLDCRSYYLSLAKKLMEQYGACVVATGEVVGQRPMSQKFRDMGLVAAQAGLEGRLLRPLSAKRLPPTIPEQEGIIDRSKLYDFSGRSRKSQIELAKKLGLKRVPDASPGCVLTEASFAPRIHDLFAHDRHATLWDGEVLMVGRHLRKDPSVKFVIGRDAKENKRLEILFRRRRRSDCALILPGNFMGPYVLAIGKTDEDTLTEGGRLAIRFTNRDVPTPPEVDVVTDEGMRRIAVPEPAWET